MVFLEEVGTGCALRVGVDDTLAGPLRPSAGSQNLLGLRDDLIVEDIDELALLRGRGILDVVGDEDGPEARDSKRPGVEAVLEVIGALAVRHDCVRR